MLFGRSIALIAVTAASIVGLAACTSQTQGLQSSPSATGNTLTNVPGLSQAALDVMNQPAYANGQWAVSVQDMDSGQQIVSLNASTFFEPGSVVKTYSIGAAWQKFGPDSTVVTPVKSTGQVVNGTLNGNLILVGMGDLTMGGRTKADGTVDFTNGDHNDANGVPGATLTTEDPLTGLDQLAAQVKAAGINSVSGDVIVDDRLWDPTQLAGEPVTPIIINQNVIDVTVTPGAVGQNATSVMSPVVAPWSVDDQVMTVAAGGQTMIKVSSPDEKTIVLTGTIAADAGPLLRVYAFTDPATFARTAYIEALQRAGVTVTADPTSVNPDAALPAEDAVSALPVVAKLTSLPFLQDATYTMKISYNRGAQTMICQLAVASGSKDCDDDGLPAAAKVWSAAGLDTTQAVLIDGSGLLGNKITANNEVQLQSIMAQRPDAAQWRSTMPGLGIDGSLANVQTGQPAAGKVVGKTGTLGAQDAFNQRLFLPTKALGGYIDTKSGRHFAFAIMVNSSVFADVNGLLAANEDVGKIAASIQQAY